MKISTTKKAAILATVLSGFVLGSSAEAAKLGVVTASDYVTSHMGALEGSFIHSDGIRAEKSVIVGLNRDPAVYNTIDPITGKSSLYIRQYNYSTTNLQNSYAFDAQGDWGVRAVGNTSKAVNAHDVVRYNDYVYVASYDEGTVGIAQITGDTILDMPTVFVNLKEDLKRYAKITYGESAQFHGEGMVIIDNALYVIANVNPYGGYKPYDGSYLMKYVIQKDGSLKYDGYTQMGKNTDSVALNVYNNYIMTTAIGGYQNYGAEYSNEETTLNVATVHPEYNYLQGSRAINLPENLYTVRDGKTVLKSEFRSLKVMPNGTAYVMTYNIGRGGDNVDVTVYQTTVSNLLSNRPQNWQVVYEQEAAPGWFGRLDAEYNTKRLWVQVGNKLNIFTDGATAENGEMISLGTQDFTTSPLYNELYTWDIISTDVIPEGNLVTLRLATGEAKTNGNTNVWKDELGNVTNVERLVNVDYQNIESKDNLISITTGSLDKDGKAIEGNLTNNVLAGIYAEGKKSTVIANDGLQIQVENNIASPVGIYAGNGGSATFTSTSGDLNIITKTMDGGNTLTNAIWLDPSKNGGESITITAGNTNLTMEGGYGGNGVAIQKTDRWGENSKESTKGGTITIKGDLNIKGKDNETWGIGANPTNVLSRFNNAGILVDVNNSEVKVTGNVDMDVYGNGVTVIGENSTVTIAKGGSITVPTGTNYGYYALAAYDKGTINMNANGDANTVKLDGDIFATKGSTINLGLATTDSYLNGIIDNGGTANITLKNGAKWNNVANNRRYTQDNEDKGDDERSHVSLLKGGTNFDEAGTIVQNANSKLLYIGKLDGTVKVNYECDVLDKNIENSVTINSAAGDSKIALFTKNSGIDTGDQDAIDAVLNALANKLYYNAYVTGERNLTGIAVGIGEGITASSVQKQADIKFDEVYGQGSLTGEVGEGTGINPDFGEEEGSKELNTPFTPVDFPFGEGNPNHNAEFKSEADRTEAVDIKGLSSQLKFAGDTAVISVVDDENANVGNDVLAAIYGVDATKGQTVTTKGGSSKIEQVLQIQAKSDEKSPVAIYIKDGGIIQTIKAYCNNASGKMNIITETGKDNLRTNAVWVDPSTQGGETLALQSDVVNITMIGGYGGNGIAITRNDGASASNNGGTINIGGHRVKGKVVAADLNIKGQHDNEWGIEANPVNGIARLNNAGILVDVDFSSVNVTGNANMDIYGNGVTVDGKGSSVVITKGGTITVPTGTDYAYYTLAAYRGTIDMNASAGANVVQLNGDVFANKGGTINLGLATNDSYLNGIIDNGGTVNLTLKNGATWSNVANNSRYALDDEYIGSHERSHITTLKGGTSFDNAGTIIQTLNSDNLYIDQLQGTVKVNYDSYDSEDVTKINGGNVTIDTATENSQIALITNNNGINTDDQEKVDAVLNALANKLYYNAYVTGERNLTGIAVGIGEALTASSIKKQAEIKFIKTTGQGSLTGEISDGTGVNPDSGIEDPNDDTIPSAYYYENKAKTTLAGTLTINTKGHGITLDGNSSTIVTTPNSSGYYEITVPEGDEKNYYALNVLSGTINLGLAEWSNSYKNTKILGTAKINGDVYIGADGDVHIGLMKGDSVLNGTVVNEGGAIDLQIAHDAEWHNVSNNKNNKNGTSYINNLGIGRRQSSLTDTFKEYTVGAGEIHQSADSGDIVVGTLASVYKQQSTNWGYTDGADARIYYTIDEENPAVVKGGNVVINSAAAGSEITLCANWNPAITKDNLWRVFNGLANKLYYLGYIYKTDDKGNLVDAEGNICDENGNVIGADGNVIEGKEFVPVPKEDNLKAYVQVTEGMTTSSITTNILENGKVPDNISDIGYNDADNSLNATVKWNGVTGQGSLTGELIDGTGFYEENNSSASGGALKNANGTYARAIYGDLVRDSAYRSEGVLEDDGTFNFNDAVTIFETEDQKIDGGAYHTSMGVAISAHTTGNKAVVNLNNNDLLITNTSHGSGASITAINGGVVEIKNAGNIVINDKGMGRTAGIFANSGGEIYIDNANGGVVSVRANAGGANGNTDSAYAESGVGIKTMNGENNACSKIVITGNVDVVADRNNGSNEAISAVASIIEVGGGNIQAINDAWAAIRAYGEFVSKNSGVVNVNVVKKVDENGNIEKDENHINVDLIAGAGNNKTNIVGDFVTNGGMGTKGVISVGLGTADSSWFGNYGDTRGYGVTQGMEGQVNLFMKNGATWTGFNDGLMNLTMESGATWYGFNLCDVSKFSGTDAFGKPFDYYAGGLNLNLSDGALWINAISDQQKKHNGEQAYSYVNNFVGDGGYIDMTGRKTFLAINAANHQAGSDGLSSQNTGIVEYGDKYQTGNLVITNYSGDTTVIYRHDNTDATNILGGTTTIKKASEGSIITLSTDSTGIDMTNTTQVTDVLDKLAEKLFYNAYTDGERNLSGKVQIAEGLTTSSAGKYFGEIEFDASNNGQGGMKDGSLTKPGNTPTVPPSGDDDQDDNEQGGNEGGNQGGTTTPEQPEQKPVVEEEIKGAITGDSLTDTTDENPYKDLIGKDDKGNDVIGFGKLDKEDSKVDIVKIEAQETEGGKNSVIAAAPSKPVIIDVAGKDLAVNSSATSEALGIQAIGGDVTIKDAGYVTITADAGVTGSASAIYAKGGENKANVTIENSDTVKLIAKGNANDAVLHADTNSNVNIKGKVEITDTNGKVAVEVAKGSTVALGGGVIGDKDTVAIAAKDGGSIVINKEGGQNVVINGKIVLGNPQGKMMMMKAAPKAIVVPAGASSFNLTDDQSSMNGDVQYTGTGNNDFVAGISNGAKWTGNSVGGVDLTVLLDDSGVWTGFHEDVVDSGTGEVANKFNLDIAGGATWNNTATDDTTIYSLTGAIGEGAKTGYIQMSENRITDDAGNERYVGLTIGEYSGETTFVYANNYGEEGKDLIQGGTVKIEAAADGSIATMRTNNIGTSKQEEVKKVLDALAQKLTYDGKDDGKLTGKVQIMEGMTTSSAMRTGSIEFDANGKGTYKDGSVENTYTGDYIYGDSETAMMKGAKSAMASTVMMWRSESNDLLQRMGDVRLATEESGVWAKYYGGKYEMDAQNTNFSTNYKAYQVGYDKAVGNGWNVGVAVSHNEGDSRYDRGGEGEMTVTSLSVYGNKDYGDGRYLGLILKGSQLKNEYEVYNNDGYKLEGDFKTWGTSISAEYGKRIEKGNGFYFDPSVELTIGHVQGKDYTATSDMLAAYGKTATMQVEQDDFNSIIGRVGFGIGQRTDKASYYAKLALAHEFGGDFDTNYTAEETKGTNIDFGDTWYEMQLGGTAKLSDNSLLYATYERSFGGDVTEKWRVDAGLRVTF